MDIDGNKVTIESDSLKAGPRPAYQEYPLEEANQA